MRKFRNRTEKEFASGEEMFGIISADLAFLHVGAR